ncbi:hypothetical protein CC78DRAFT_573932 [Lojkania enalia]|uniref:Anaphase-promoting complex subunit CDC26 n=1 Tax=Lojkania enalia TaxID=147567 RepID=A0A9P4TRS4_9PLEO|nr:hypothetical protein CC78DRAFT_573932 [Didymosphaeria enalia]
MLRRAPTTITLTDEDVKQYEKRREQILWLQQQQQASAQSTDSSNAGKKVENSQGVDTAAQEKSKKDRIMGYEFHV